MVSFRQIALATSLSLNCAMAYLVFAQRNLADDSPQVLPVSDPVIRQVSTQPSLINNLTTPPPLERPSDKVWLPFGAYLLGQCPVDSWIGADFKILEEIQNCLELTDSQVTEIQEHMLWAVDATTALEAKHARIIESSDSHPYIYVAPHASAQRLIYADLTRKFRHSLGEPVGTLLSAVAIQSPLLNLGDGEQKWWTETGVSKKGRAWRMLNIDIERNGAKKQPEWPEYPEGALGVRFRQFMGRVQSGSK